VLTKAAALHKGPSVLLPSPDTSILTLLPLPQSCLNVHQLFSHLLAPGDKQPKGATTLVHAVGSRRSHLFKNSLSFAFTCADAVLHVVEVLVSQLTTLILAT
jgi:hypothetical protein